MLGAQATSGSHVERCQTAHLRKEMLQQSRQESILSTDSRLSWSQQPKEKVHKERAAIVALVGPRPGNRNANRIQSGRLSIEEGCPHIKNEHISCLLDCGSYTPELLFLGTPIGALYTPPHSIRYTVLRLIICLHPSKQSLSIYYVLNIRQALQK